MRTVLITFFLLAAGTLLPGYASAGRDTTCLYKFRILSASNLNFNSVLTADSLIRFGRVIEAEARKTGNIGAEFKAGQVQTNAYALEGRMALAVNKAGELWDKAALGKEPLAIGLAAQAAGDTYLFTGQYKQADSLFTLAWTYIDRHGDASMQAELLLQRLHTNLYLPSADRMPEDFKTLHTLLGQNRGEVFRVYGLLLQTYEALFAIRHSDAHTAEKIIRQLREQQHENALFSKWLYYLQARYDSLVKNHESAVIHSDSLINTARQGGNGSGLRQALLFKASLLENMGRASEAASLYELINQTTDSLHRSQYISQIDSMHVTYWVDQLQMDNITRRNQFNTRLITGLLALLVITIVVIVLVRRENHRLVASHRKLKALREASADSIRTKSLFLSNMSHELRTPLNAITGFSSLLTDDPELDEQTRSQCSDYIRQNADLLLKIISDVVDLSVLQNDQIQFTYAPCEVVSLCRNVLSTVDNVKRTEARMTFETDLEQLDLCGDKNRLQQVLINLLVNATKFTRSGTITLRLAFDPERSEAIFTVEDTGCGIPLDRQSHIFERFEKLHEGIQGAGLGLSICKLIVEYTGGRIWIDSSHTHGARFVFTHPLTPKEKPEAC